MHDYRYTVIGCYFSISVNEIKLQNKCLFIYIFYVFSKNILYFTIKNARKKKCQYLTAYIFKMSHFQKSFNHMELVSTGKKTQDAVTKIH